MSPARIATCPRHSIGTPRDGNLGLFAGSDPDADRILALGDPLFSSAVAELASNPVSV